MRELRMFWMLWRRYNCIEFFSWLKSETPCKNRCSYPVIFSCIMLKAFGVSFHAIWITRSHLSRNRQIWDHFCIVASFTLWKVFDSCLVQSIRTLDWRKSRQPFYIYTHMVPCAGGSASHFLHQLGQPASRRPCSRGSEQAILGEDGDRGPCRWGPLLWPHGTQHHQWLSQVETIQFARFIWHCQECLCRARFWHHLVWSTQYRSSNHHTQGSRFFKAVCNIQTLLWLRKL